MSDIIFALATAPGRAGVAVVRISGTGSRDALTGLAGALPEAGRSLRVIKGPSGASIDQALVLMFPRGSSFTGEEVVELHLHGSPAVVGRVLEELSALPGLRMAEPGEFTRRALDNGRLNLAEVEGLADLIDSETEAQRRQAMRVFSGELGEEVERWRAKLIRAMALIEATIDFADEEVPVDVTPEVLELIDEVHGDLSRSLSGYAAAERVRDGFEVAIIGAPNVGKSTLLNRLAGRDAAITSEFAGTTRDVIEVRMDIGGLAVTLLDTAGLRDATDAVEEIGIERGQMRARQADLRVRLVDGDMASEPEDDLTLLRRAMCDEGGPHGVSGLTGFGVDALLGDIEAKLKEIAAPAGLVVRERHRAAVEMAIGQIDGARAALGADLGGDLVAEDLRMAVRSVEGLVGRVDTDDILGEIFSSFCIGK